MPDTSLILQSQKQNDLPLQEERLLIADAQDVTNERRRNWAIKRLEAQCKRLLDHLIYRFKARFPYVELDELRSASVEGFYRAIYRFDFSKSARLTSVVFIYVRDALQRCSQQEKRYCQAVSVSKRTAVGFSLDPDVRDYYLIALLKRLLTALSPTQQQVICLRFQQNRMTWSQIACKLGEKKQAVERKYYRGLKKLQGGWYATTY